VLRAEAFDHAAEVDGAASLARAELERRVSALAAPLAVGQADVRSVFAETGECPFGGTGEQVVAG
jgi:hypothetical protein